MSTNDQPTTEIVPTILTGSIENAQSLLTSIQGFPMLETVHIDVLDGSFTDEVTITPTDVLALYPGALQIDFHLMVDEPLDYVYECVNFADRLPIRSVIAQVEKMSFQADYLQDVRANGWRTGLSLDLHTPLEAIDARSWEHLDILQLMAVEVGAQGQIFNQSVLFKIKEAWDKIQAEELATIIMVDGGIKLENIAALRAAQVESFVIGSGLWAEDDVLSLEDAVSAFVEAVGI